MSELKNSNFQSFMMENLKNNFGKPLDRDVILIIFFNLRHWDETD